STRVATCAPCGATLLAWPFSGAAARGNALGFGWAKPTPVNPMNLAGGRRGEAIVAAAGPISNLVLAIAGALPLRYLVHNPELVQQLGGVGGIPFQVLYLFVQINLLLMVFNLTPMRPLASHK